MDRLETEFTTVRVPSHLSQFVVDQDYGKYTPIDQAVWRYVMRQNHSFLGIRAHGAYIDGLRTSGISIEKIPNVTEMNESLSKIGWGAVTIDGFIPAVAFFDFQAHNILPIACDIRTYDHIAYTPAPDIIHEAAGHSPIIKDEKYRSYLKVFGEIGSKAISSWEDYEVYEAIRLLSIVKEDPNATEEEVRAAEEDLERKVRAVTEVSEAAKLSRLYWWTVEYGLIGDLQNPQIYGAGLLSSVGESISCLKDDVKKIPFSLHACIDTDFDITKPQPQLFVCKDFDELIAAVQEFSKTMAMSVGGTSSLIMAQKSGQTSTSVYSSGLQVSGKLTKLEFDTNNEAIYLNTTGPTALAVQNSELAGHGKAYHSEGFGSPIGLFKGVDTPPENLTDEQLQSLGIFVGNTTTLVFASGVQVCGKISYVLRENGMLVLIGFDECTVTYGDKTLFQAAWGTFDMAVGARITSVFAGAADRETFEIGTHQPSATITKRPTYTEGQKRQHALYQQVRDLREQPPTESVLAETVANILAELDRSYPKDWLIRLELLEILKEHNLRSDKQHVLRVALEELAKDEEVGPLIRNGLSLVDEMAS